MGVGGTLDHKRLNPHRKDLFIRGVGFGADYVLDIGDAYANAGIDIHDITGWGHDATEDGSIFTYYRAGTIASIGGLNGNEVIAQDTGWWWQDPNQSPETQKKRWPRHEWEFKLDADPEDAWTPIDTWDEPNELSLDIAYAGSSGDFSVAQNYAIRMPVPHINVLIIKQDTTRASIRFDQDGHIFFKSAIAPDRNSIWPDGFRNWGWTTKGYCSTTKEDEQPSMYGFAVHLEIPLKHYFNDRPYVDGTTWTGSGWGDPDGMLAPLGRVEDQNDNLTPEDGILADTPN